MRSPVLLLFAGALALAACSPEAGEPTGARSQPLSSASSASAEDFDADQFDPGQFDPDKERAIKRAGQAATITKRVAQIDWDAAKSHPTAELDSLGEEQRARLVAAPVPALVPDRPELLASATITGGEHWYAASLDGEGHSVYVSGTRLETVVPGLAVLEEQSDLAQDFRITRNELIVSLTFNAFGAAYVLEVECAQPSTDSRCTEDDYAVALANSLVLPKVALEGGER